MMKPECKESRSGRAKVLIAAATIVLLLLSVTGCSFSVQDASVPVSTQTNEIPQGSQPNLKVSYLDVGQADSILIQVPNGKNILIDAGNNEDAEMITAYLKKQGIHRLDVVIGTHPHEDHIGSLDKVIQTFEIGQVIMPKVTTNTQTFKDVLTAIQNKGLKIKEAKAGLKLELGPTDAENPQISAEILAPASSQYEDMNNYSAVLRLVYGQNTFLFTGDAEDVSEKEMLASSANLKADVLKVGHHGSNSSTTQEFLNKVNPKYAIISVGKDNTYGHPTPSTLSRLKKSGVEVYRTDEEGTIIAESDGSKISFKTNK